MDSSSSISSSNFLAPDFFINDSEITEYIELPCKSSFNRIYKIKRFGQWFILKALKPEFVSQSLYVSLIKKEFDLAVQLDHPYIVKTILKENNKRVGPAIMMEYVDGMTLDEFIKMKPSKQDRLRVVHQILSAMQYFHSKQIIHRDLKPSNILITHNGYNVKIIDFGLADADSYDIFKQPAGTKKYAAPEQMQLGCHADVRSDIYSFGKILREIFPKRYHAIIHRCLRFQPERRFQNVEDILSAFKFRKRLFYAVLFIFVMSIILLPNILWLNNYNKKASTEGLDQEIVKSSLTQIDSIYKPLIRMIENGEFEYREFASLCMLETYDAINSIRDNYEKDISDTIFGLTNFRTIYNSRWGSYLQDINDDYIVKLPSFYESFSNGKISYDEFTKLEKEYEMRLEKLQMIKK